MVKFTANVNAFYGDQEFAFDFPDGWEVEEMNIAGHDSPLLTADQIREALNNPIGTMTIGEMAKGRRGRIAILVDDLQRPTPAELVVPHVIEELKKVGIADRQIFFIGAGGSHSEMDIDMFARKIGSEIIEKYDCRDHTCHDLSYHGARNFVDLGYTSFGTPLQVSKDFASADLRIAISGVKKHICGAGGGGKIVLPGVSSLKTIAYNHTRVGWAWPANPDITEFKIKGNPMRDDIQEAARMANLEFSINCVYNGKRELIGLFAGDLDEAWREGVKFCYKMHATKPREGKADIVVTNSYPQAYPVVNWYGIGESLRNGGTAVSIHLHSLGKLIRHHGRDVLYGYLWQLERGFPYKKWPAGQASKAIVFDERPFMRMKMEMDSNVEWIKDWKNVIERLKAIHGDEAKVAFYPCGPLHFNPDKKPLII